MIQTTTSKPKLSTSLGGTIEKNIPIPTREYDKKRPINNKYGFLLKMEVGDSVLFPSRAAANNLISSFNRTANFTAKTRTVNTAGSIRVWKVLREGTDDLDQEYEKLLTLHEQEDQDEYQANA